MSTNIRSFIKRLTILAWAHGFISPDTVDRMFERFRLKHSYPGHNRTRRNADALLQRMRRAL